MDMPSRGGQAQDLPREVLTLIFKTSCRDPMPLGEVLPDELSTWRKVYTRYALVCRAWRRPAQRCLYAFVHVFSPAVVPKLHASLINNGRDGRLLASFVKNIEIDPHKLDSATVHQVVDIVGRCPNLHYLGCSAELAHRFAEGPLEKALSLDSIVLYDGDLGRHDLFASMSSLFDAYRLRTLQLVSWTLRYPAYDIVLPNLETLVLQACELHVPQGPPKPFFPALHRLRRLLIPGCCEPPELSGDPLHQVMDNFLNFLLVGMGSTLRELELTRQQVLALRNNHLEQVPHLEHLLVTMEDPSDKADDNASEPFADEEEEAHCFGNLPASLLTVEIQWWQSAAQAVWFFKALQSPSFLPNLTALPVLARLERRFSDASKAEFFEQQARAREAMRKRGLAKSEADFKAVNCRFMTIWQEEEDEDQQGQEQINHLDNGGEEQQEGEEEDEGQEE